MTSQQNLHSHRQAVRGRPEVDGSAHRGLINGAQDPANSLLLLESFGGASGIDLRTYLLRLMRHIPQLQEVGDTAVLLLLRLSRRLRSFLCDLGISITSANEAFTPFPPSKIHRLCLCSVVIAVKLHCDELRDNRFYASVGGVSLLQMNACGVFTKLVRQ